MYVLAVLVSLAIVSALVVLNPYSYANLACEQWELPNHEKAFGFRFGQVRLPGGPDAHRMVPAITEVAPGSVAAQAGLRAGDRPRMHHGLGEFCGELTAITEGRSSSVQVMNVYDAQRGELVWREISFR